MDLSIITINYETAELLRDLLSSLNVIRNNDELSFEVIVVNVTPKDGSEIMVRKSFSWVKQIIDTRNLGFSGNNNIGLKDVTGRYVLFLNSDTTVQPGTLSQMVTYMDKNEKVGAATCYVELASGGMDPDCHRGFPTPWAALTYFLGLEKLFPQSRVFGQYHQFYKDLSQTHEIDACAGAFLLMPRKLGGKIDLRKSSSEENNSKVPSSNESEKNQKSSGTEPLGTSDLEFDASGRSPRPAWWDEDFFFYGEDLDLCWRVKEAGYKVMFYPHVKIIHHKGGSSGIREESQDVSKASKETKKRILPETTRAMRLFYQKHFQKKYPRFVTLLVFAGISVLEKIRTVK